MGYTSFSSDDISRATVLVDVLKQQSGALCIAYEKDGKIELIPMREMVIAEFVTECRKRKHYGLVKWIQDTIRHHREEREGDEIEYD